jgi:2,4-dienoyl-CoA reductase-like NADH-dependent reductase (Old Yellow Enzyme family)
MTSTSDPLLQPLRLKTLTLKNRVMSTAHAPAYVEDGLPQLRYQLYHEEKAKGGLALTMFGGSSTVAPESPSAFGQIDISHDRIIPVLQQFSARIHAHGCALMVQITHMGRRTRWDVADWLPPVAPSPVRELQHRSFPKELEPEDIARIVEAYGAGARRAREGGLDGVELIASSHLPDQFWSPTVNHRGDLYGGSLANRMRFSLEVLEAMRRATGDDFVVGLRMSGDEMLEGGLSREEMAEIAVTHAQSGLIDYLNIVRAHATTDLGISELIPTMGQPSGPFLARAAEIRAASGIPVFHATRIADLSTARHAIEAGHVDMVGMTRAHIADPHIVAKLARGEEDRIRPCVGAGYCIDRIYTGGDALCIHNAATGRERTMPHVIRASDGPRRRVAIVGGGPAGLEAARVTAARGHEVVLHEATDRLGGQVVLAARLDRRREIIGITDWLAAEARHHGADLRLNSYLESDDILAGAPDVVVIATGGTPNTSFLEGGQDLVTTSWDVLGGQAALSGEVLVYDENGQHQAPTCAEYLARRGLKVELATPDRMPAIELGATNSARFMRELYGLGVTCVPDRKLLAVAREGNRLTATFRNMYTNGLEERRYDHVVVEHGTVPAAELYLELKAGSRNQGMVDQAALVAARPQPAFAQAGEGYLLYRVGDAVASRNIHAAVYDSLRLLKDL